MQNVLEDLPLMKKKIRFVKMQALGNDFVILDRITQSLTITPDLIARIGHRQLGIGCDQVLIVDPPSQPNYDFNYRIFNANGDEVEQCGNGTRCFGRYVYEKGLTDKNYLTIGCLANPIYIDLNDPMRIEVLLGKPKFPPSAKDFHINTQKINALGRYKIPIYKTDKEVTLLSIGNPHCVLSVSNVKDTRVTSIGKLLQNDPTFPKGVNVSFVEVLARNHIKLRVYERGVGETQACGTAACAAVIAGVTQGELNTSVQVDMSGGSLSVNYDTQKGVSITGNTHTVFEGTFVINQTYEYEFAF